MIKILNCRFLNAAQNLSDEDITPSELQEQLTEFIDQAIYNELPITFETGEGVEIAKAHKVSERTFKDWLKSGFFRHIKHGTYEKLSVRKE